MVSGIGQLAPVSGARKWSMRHQLKSVMHGQCDARPTVIFPNIFQAAERASPLFGRYQIILLGDQGTCERTSCPRLLPGSGPAVIQTHDLIMNLMF